MLPITVFPRIISTEIKSSNFRTGSRALRTDAPEGEISVSKASCTYSIAGIELPISIHIDTYPGSIPSVGDHLKVTIEACTPEEGQAASQK